MNKGCACAETSYFRAKGLPIPVQHDCAYVAERNAMIPVVLRALGIRVGETESIRDPEDTQRFLAEMDRRMRVNA